MKNNFKKANIYITLTVIILIGGLAYLIIPSSFWKNTGSSQFKSPVHGGSMSSSRDGGPTPTSLQFKDPFKYDNYKPSKKDEFLKKREENKKEGGNLFWK